MSNATNFATIMDLVGAEECTRSGVTSTLVGTLSTVILTGLLILSELLPFCKEQCEPGTTDPSGNKSLVHQSNGLIHLASFLVKKL